MDENNNNPEAEKMESQSSEANDAGSLHTSEGNDGSFHVNERLPNGSTHLIEAIFAKNASQVRELMALGANPFMKKIEEDGREVWDAFEFAINSPEDEIARLLINYQHPESKETLLHHALAEGNLERAAMLFHRGGIPLLERSDHTSAVELAVATRSRAMVHFTLCWRDHFGEGDPLLLAVVKSIIETQEDEALQEARILRLMTILEHDGLFILTQQHRDYDWKAALDSLLPFFPSDSVRDVVMSGFSRAEFKIESFPPTDNFLTYASRHLSLPQSFDPAEIFEWQNTQILDLKEHGFNSFFADSNISSVFFGNPSVPTFHSYQIPLSGTVMATSLPLSAVLRLPQTIQYALLSVSRIGIDQIECFLCVQSMEQPFGEDDRVLFRPHYWIDPTVPEEFDGVKFCRFTHLGLFPFESFDSTGNPNASLFIQHFVAHDGAMSPNVIPLNYSAEVPTKGAGIWSVIVDADRMDQPRRAAVTLHWFLEPAKRSEVFDALSQIHETRNLTVADALQSFAQLGEALVGFSDILRNWIFPYE
jgi:hypothetical protein